LLAQERGDVPLREQGAPIREFEAGFMFDRRAFLTAGAAVTLFPSRVRAQGLTKIRIAASADGSVIGALYGAQSGIFQKYGLDVQVTRSSSGSAISAAVIGGSLELGKASLFGIIEGHVHGIPLVLQSGASVFDSANPTAGFLVAKNSPIRTGSDLNGKIIAVSSLGDLFAVASWAWIDQHGGDWHSVKLAELPASAAADAIAAGRVDAATLAVPTMSDAVASGKCRLLGDSCGAVAKQFFSTTYFSTAEYAAKNADALARFRKGLAESTAYAVAHWNDMIPLLSKYTGIEPGVIAATQRDKLQSALDPALIQPLIDAAVKYKVIPARFLARELIDPAALA
jgi:NitT/TauT family transport system substrate-binding protein